MYIIKINDYFIKANKTVNKHGQVVMGEDSITTKIDLASQFDLHIAQYLKTKYTKLLNIEVKLLKVVA